MPDDPARAGERAAAWRAADVAADSAGQTAQLSPRNGRARPLAERIVGNPDPGAVPLVMALRAAAPPTR